MSRSLLDSIASLFSADTVERLGWVLVHSLWQFAAIALVALFLDRLLKRRSAAIRYATLLVGLLMMVLTSFVTWLLLPDSLDASSGPDVSIVEAAPAEQTHDVAMTNGALPTHSRPTVGPDPENTVGAFETSTITASEATLGAESWLDRLATILNPWLTTLVGAWCCGVVLFSLRPVVSWINVHRLTTTGVSPVSSVVQEAFYRVQQRLKIDRRVQVLQSIVVNSPIVVGCFRSTILLPASFISGVPVSQLEAILAHELAHVRRYDYLVNLLQTLVETLFFYHPAVWWISHRIRDERENCCDDLVVAALGNKIEYGRALLAVEQCRSAATSSLALSARGGSLLTRVKRLFADPVQDDRSSSGLAAIGILLAMITATGVWTTVIAGVDAAKNDVAVDAIDDDVAPERTTIRGRVVAEDDTPAGDAIVEAHAKDGTTFTTTANEGGQFELSVPKEIENLVMTIRDQSDTMMWVGDVFPGGPQIYRDVKQGEPLTAVLSPIMRSELHVVDDAGEPVSAATVVVQSQTDLISVLKTDESGHVIVRLPQRTFSQTHGSPRVGGDSVPMIMAFKSRVGYDYFSADVRDGNNYPVKNPPKLPEQLKLTLNGSKTVRLKAVDTQGQPMDGVTIRPWYVVKEGNPGDTYFGSHAFAQMTDRNGIAVFDWLPPNVKRAVTFWAQADDFDADRVVVQWAERDESHDYEVTLRRRTELSGHVVDPDGQPVQDAVVKAHGQGAGLEAFGMATTEADGTFSMNVSSDKAYVAHVRQGDLVGYFGRIVLIENKPVTDVDIPLVKGTMIRGQVTRGTPPVPVKGQSISLQLELGGLPDEINSMRREGDNLWYSVSHRDALVTDDNGKFEFVAAPGEYILFGPQQAEQHKFTVTDEAELEFNFHVPHKELNQLAGVVRDPDGKPVAEAKIYGVYEGTTHSRHAFSGKTNAEGRFDVERETQPAMVHILSADESYGSIVSIEGDVESFDVDLKPTYSARGRLLQDSGDAFADAKVKFSVRVYRGEKGTGDWVPSFGSSVLTDADGKYTLEHLVQGAEYDILLEHSENGPWTTLKSVKHDSADAVDLGDVRR